MDGETDGEATDDLGAIERGGSGAATPAAAGVAVGVGACGARDASGATGATATAPAVPAFDSTASDAFDSTSGGVADATAAFGGFGTGTAERTGRGGAVPSPPPDLRGGGGGGGGTLRTGADGAAEPEAREGGGATDELGPDFLRGKGGGALGPAAPERRGGAGGGPDSCLSSAMEVGRYATNGTTSMKRASIRGSGSQAGE